MQIKVDGAHHLVEGAFLANEHIVSLTFTALDGSTVRSSLTGTGILLSMFRLRHRG